MRILIVGYLPIPRNITGGTKVIDLIVDGLRRRGHYVEVFSAFKHNEDKFIIKDTFYKGVVHRFLLRDKGIYYYDLFNPMNEVYEEKTEKIFFEFLDKNPNWDVIHFFHMMPLSIIEKVKDKGYRVFITLNDFQYMFGGSIFLFSKKRYLYSHNSHWSITDFSPESLIEELAILYDNYQLMEKKNSSNLIKAYNSRLNYGKYLLGSVVDGIIGINSFREVYNFLFGVEKDRFLPISIYYSHGKPIKLKRKNREKIIFGNTDYWAIHKGISFLINIIDNLREYEGKFEFRFFGKVDVDNEFYNEIMDRINSDEFLSSHIKLITPEGYSSSDLDYIASEIDVVVNINTNLYMVGSTMTELLSRGVIAIMSRTGYQYKIIESILKGKDYNYFLESYKKEYEVEEFNFSKVLYEEMRGLFEDGMDKKPIIKDYFEMFLVSPGNFTQYLEKIKFLIENQNKIDEYRELSLEFAEKAYSSIIKEDFITQLEGYYKG